MRKIRIVSDGTPAGTKVIDVESGEALEGVASVSWCVSVDEISKANIGFVYVPLELDVTEAKEDKE